MVSEPISSAAVVLPSRDTSELQKLSTEWSPVYVPAATDNNIGLDIIKILSNIIDIKTHQRIGYLLLFFFFNKRV